MKNLLRHFKTKLSNSHRLKKECSMAWLGTGIKTVPAVLFV